MSALLVIVPDWISAIVAKGEYQPRYYNPGNLFDDVHILMTNADRPDPVALQPTVGRARLHLHNLPEPAAVQVSDRPADDWQYLDDWAAPAVALAAAIGPDLIRCHGADFNVYAAMTIKRELGIPYVVSLHINPDVNATRRVLGSDLTDEQRRLNTVFEHVEREGLRGADLVLPVYRPILPYLERLGIDRVEVCYNVLNAHDIRPKESYALGKPVRIISVGRQFKEKNPENLIRALAGLPGFELTLVGDGPLHDHLRAAAAACGVEDRVLFRPAVPNAELCRSLAGYDIFAVHSEYWEINKSVLEALLTGLPVVLNRRQGLPVPELEGDFMLKVDNTVESYRETLRTLAEDHGARERLGRRAREHAASHWAPAVTEAKYVEIYRQVMRPRVGSNRPPPRSLTRYQPHRDAALPDAKSVVCLLLPRHAAAAPAVGPAAGIVARWRARRDFLVGFYANPRSPDYMVGAVREFLVNAGWQQMADLVADRAYEAALDDEARRLFRSVVIAPLAGTDAAARLRGATSGRRPDALLLVWPDALGFGNEALADAALSSGIPETIVLNGRRRAFRLDARSRALLAGRRLLARLRVGEWLFALAILPVGAAFVLVDGVRAAFARGRA
jgi:glycosyltransferase involved in cell wall biosynthesis